MALAYIQNRVEQSVSIVLDSSFNERRWVELMAIIEEKGRSAAQSFVLDMRQLEFISSQFLGLLLELNGRLIARGAHLRLTVTKQSRINQILILACLNRVIPISES